MDQLQLFALGLQGQLVGSSHSFCQRNHQTTCDSRHRHDAIPEHVPRELEYLRLGQRHNQGRHLLAINRRKLSDALAWLDRDGGVRIQIVIKVRGNFTGQQNIDVMVCFTGIEQVCAGGKQQDVAIGKHLMDRTRVRLPKEGNPANGGCKNFCVNGQSAGNCPIARSDDDRSEESRTQGVAGQPVG